MAMPTSTDHPRQEVAEVLTDIDPELLVQCTEDGGRHLLVLRTGGGIHIGASQPGTTSCRAGSWCAQSLRETPDPD